MKDTVLYERFLGFADRESCISFSKDSMFSFYSLSKPFLAIGLMKLYEEGLIDIDQHPGRYIPEAQGFDPRVTFRHMLHHVICALAIENITGMTYEAYMEETVFSPLGMNARIDRKDLLLPCRVTGYEEKEGQIVPVRSCLDWMHGAGDVIGTVDDVYCLNKAIKHRLLLGKESWDQILKPWPKFNTFGMGCRVTKWHGKTRITHNGGHVGFRTLHIQLPDDDLDIIFLSNAAWGDARTDFAEAVYAAYYGEDQPAEVIEMDKGYI